MPQAAPAEPPAGWLGELLQEAQVAVEVWGDGRWFGSRPAAALPEWTRTTSPLALASLLAADRQGRVRRVHELAREDPASPLGLATDWPQLARRLRRMGCDRAAVVVASGDLWRLRWEQARMAPQALVRHHRRLAAGLDQVVRAWAEGAGSRCGSLFVAGLAPGPQARPSGEALTALLGWGPWPAGLWWGPTTRRPGLVTAVDLAPALARLAGRVPPAPAVGRPLGVLAAPAGAAGQARAEALARWARERAYIYAYRFRVLPWLTTLQVALLAMAAAVAWWYRKAAGHPAAGARRWRAAVQRALEAVRWAGCVPLALLHPWAAVGPGAGLVGPGWSLAFVSACSLALGWASGVLARRLGLSGAGWVALAGAGVLLADLAGQWDLVARSFMGYDLTAGARFYGIGNEHMGLLLGSTLVVLAELAGRFPWGTALGVALVGVAGMLVGSPARGANVGGTVAFAVALAVLAQGARAARCGVAGARVAGAGLRTGPATTGLPVARALVPVAAAGLAVAGLAWWDAAQSAGG
ncbi:MAG TPA: hypothetical protein VIL11_06975, partial [Limnochordales bacterium]